MKPTTAYRVAEETIILYKYSTRTEYVPQRRKDTVKGGGTFLQPAMYIYILRYVSRARVCQVRNNNSKKPVIKKNEKHK
jgi:hypothetical protein